MRSGSSSALVNAIAQPSVYNPSGDDDDQEDEEEPLPPISARGGRPVSGRMHHDPAAQGMLAAVGANGELYTPRRSGRFDPQSTLSALGAAAAGAAFAGHSPTPTPRSSWPDGPTPRPGQHSPLPSAGGGGGGGLADRSALDRSSWLPSPRQSFGILRALSAEGSVDCSAMSKQARPHAVPARRGCCPRHALSRARANAYSCTQTRV